MRGGGSDRQAHLATARPRPRSDLAVAEVAKSGGARAEGGEERREVVCVCAERVLVEARGEGKRGSWEYFIR
uniref:Uncharacterized protein n=1 Tax=Oryza sativa subsp. japonica TaxID=39947 RepID=Q6EQF8_ORYSJ|nr:hypothetical protein [Oryza sativa Japonica Group]